MSDANRDSTDVEWTALDRETRVGLSLFLYGNVYMDRQSGEVLQPPQWPEGQRVSPGLIAELRALEADARVAAADAEAWVRDRVAGLTGKLTSKAAVEALDAIGGRDPEKAHFEADEILLRHAAPEVAEAYERLANRAGSWWYA